MKALKVVASVIVEEYEIEEHVQKHNRFFKLSGFTLDDLDFYAEPLAKIVLAANGQSNDSISEWETLEAVWLAVKEIKALDARLDQENAAEVAQKAA